METIRGIDLPHPTYVYFNIPKELSELKNYSELQTYIPPMKTFFGIEEKNIIFENKYRIQNIDLSKNCMLDVIFNNKKTKIQAHMKVTHIYDPIRYIQNDKEEDPTKKNDPWNQAYIETVASFILGKLKEENISPHFNLFYGAFSAIADKYSYNISDEVESYRMYKWFWSAIERKFIKIEVEGDDETIKKDIYDEIMIKPEYCLELNEDNDTEELSTTNTDNSESHSLETATIKTSSTNEGDDNEDDDKDDDEYKVFLNLEKFPVMMIFTEQNESTMDDLLEDYDEVGCKPNTKMWEDKWSAWIFQVISALCVIQKVFSFTHNDLHTNNIVWAKTEEKYLYYKTTDNKVFKVPTYGKIFKLIDFGRSIFAFNEHIFVSDDFREGNDAATQYNFPPLIMESNEERIYPNPSFDLARLSISFFESIFPDPLKDKENAKILSNQTGKIVKEKTSDLYNLLWTWLIDKDGNNILYDEDDEERFPDFGLYVHIAKNCKNGIPKEQIYKKPFIKFLVNSVPKNVKFYNLYV